MMQSKISRYILKYAIFVYLSLCTKPGESSNIDVRDGNTKFIRSPIIRATSGATGLPDAMEPSYYGYAIRFSKVLSANTLYISAPKITNAAVPQEHMNDTDETMEGYTKPEGTVERCGISFSRGENCTSAAHPSVEPGDSFGMSMGNNGSTIWACSPAKVRNCTKSVSTPGFCYKSNDEGTSWTSLKRKADLACPIGNLDIIFVLDGSGSMSEDFATVKNWTMRVATEFDIESGTVQIGVIQYSHWFSNIKDLNKQPYIKTEIALGQFSTGKALTEAIQSINHLGSTTYTAHALNKTVLDFQSSNRWSDQSIKRVMILLTDGWANDKEFLPQSADYVRSFGIVTFAVGVGNYAETELRIIATGNLTSPERVFSVREFSGLEGIVNSLRTQILSLALEGSNSAASTSAFDMELGEEGFSIEYSTETSLNIWEDSSSKSSLLAQMVPSARFQLPIAPKVASYNAMDKPANGLQYTSGDFVGILYRAHLYNKEVGTNHPVDIDFARILVDMDIDPYHS